MNNILSDSRDSKPVEFCCISHFSDQAIDQMRLRYMKLQRIKAFLLHIAKNPTFRRPLSLQTPDPKPHTEILLYHELHITGGPSAQTTLTRLTNKRDMPQNFMWKCVPYGTERAVSIFQAVTLLEKLCGKDPSVDKSGG